MPRTPPRDETDNIVKECFICDEPLSSRVPESVPPLCEEHNTEENIEKWKDHMREKNGLECAVCGRHFLHSEGNSVDPPLCGKHDEEDLGHVMDRRRQHEEEHADELAEQYRETPPEERDN